MGLGRGARLASRGIRLLHVRQELLQQDVRRRHVEPGRGATPHQVAHGQRLHLRVPDGHPARPEAAFASSGGHTRWAAQHGAGHQQAAMAGHGWPDAP
eukprot:1790846-Pyramimonas_sp.AAC.1